MKWGYNPLGMLLKGKAIQYVNNLRRKRFSLKSNVYNKFLSELV
jgi:hypothetical protein